jgi:hypothetical protein
LPEGGKGIRGYWGNYYGFQLRIYDGASGGQGVGSGSGRGSKDQTITFVGHTRLFINTIVQGYHVGYPGFNNYFVEAVRGTG